MPIGNQFNKSCKMDVKFQNKFDDLLIKNLVLIQFVKSAYYFENFAVSFADFSDSRFKINNLF